MSKHRVMINSPREWPQWPYLPMKRRISGKMPETGLIFEHRPGVLKFAANVNMYRLEGVDPSVFKEFDIDELLAQGWEVD